MSLNGRGWLRRSGEGWEETGRGGKEPGGQREAQGEDGKGTRVEKSEHCCLYKHSVYDG